MSDNTLRKEEQIGMFEDVSKDVLNHIGDIADETRSWPKTLVELIDLISSHLQRDMELDQVAARAEARGLVLLIARQFGGRPFYLPKGRSLNKALRDRQIWEEFTGNNVNELSRRHDLTPVQIYDIINTQRQIEQKKYQSDLFG